MPLPTQGDIIPTIGESFSNPLERIEEFLHKKIDILQNALLQQSQMLQQLLQVTLDSKGKAPL